MDPNVGLVAASGLVNFLLKTTVEWLICLLLVRIAGSARSRFNLWLTMLLAFVAQWIWMGMSGARAAFPARSVAGGVAGVSAAAGKRIAIAAPAIGIVGQVIAALLAGYVLMVAWRMLGTLAARVRLARAMRYRSAPEAWVAATFEEVAAQTPVRGTELWVLPGLTSPATLGWLRPRVIVPTACAMQDEAELKAVFWHELKHVERRDALWNAVVRACRNLLWFHPAVHHAIGALNAQRELACDAAVVREHPQSRAVYAACLLRFARMADYAPEPAIPTIEMTSSAALLTMRVRSILSDGPAASRVSRVGRAAANVSLVGLMAATVPGLNVLFAAEERAVAVQMPVAAEAQGAVKRHASIARPVKMQRAGLTQLVASNAGALVGLQHDEALAAEHRAAMGILTESTGMDAAAGDGRGVSSLGGEPGRGSSGQAATTLTRVAVDAATRMGPMMSGRDGDDHH